MALDASTSAIAPDILLKLIIAVNSTYASYDQSVFPGQNIVNNSITSSETLGQPTTILTPYALVKSASANSIASSTTISVSLASAPISGNLLVFAMAGDKNTGALTLAG